MAFPTYKLPAALEPTIAANRLYGKPMVMNTIGSAHFGAREYELFTVDPDQSHVVLPGIEVTVDMIAAGVEEFCAYDPRFEGPEDVVGDIFRAMLKASKK